jgi:hypothetical protein
MRDIGSNRITGPEAVLVAAVVWWFDQSASLERYVLEAAGRAGPSRFTSRVEFELGAALEPELPVGKIVQNFWDMAGNNPAVKHMVGQALRARKGSDARQKVAETREFVHKVIVSELGLMLKQSGYLERHERSIKAAKRRKARSKRDDADE